MTAPGPLAHKPGLWAGTLSRHRWAVLAGTAFLALLLLCADLAPVPKLQILTTGHRQTFPRVPGIGCWPRDAACDPRPPCAVNDQVAVAVVSSTLPKYQNLASIVLRTWGTGFRRLRFYVADTVNAKSVPDPEVRSRTVNALKGVNVDEISMEMSKGFEDRPVAWKIGQHLFLEAARALMTEFPEALWYFIVDQDTIVRKHCLERTLAAIHPTKAPAALGDFRWPKQFMMGGAGTLWNAAAADTIDIDRCVRETMDGGAWTGLNSDWRLPRCFQEYGVAMVAAAGFYQRKFEEVVKEEELEREFWYTRGDVAYDSCSVTSHYGNAERLERVFATDMANLGCSAKPGLEGVETVAQTAARREAGDGGERAPVGWVGRKNSGRKEKPPGPKDGEEEEPPEDDR
jgi:hypothetical protein